MHLIKSVRLAAIALAWAGGSALCWNGPLRAEPIVNATPAQLVVNDVLGGTASTPQTVTIANGGSTGLSIQSLTIVTIDGTPGQFQIASQPTLPATVAPGTSVSVGIVFNPTAAGPAIARLDIATDAPATPTASMSLQGLGTKGIGGNLEPSLQWIFDTYLIAVDVGDPDPAETDLAGSVPLGGEMSIQRFLKAGSGPVTVEPLAVFAPQSNSGLVFRVGHHPSGNPAAKSELFTVADANHQTLAPPVTGKREFDPGVGSFGFYAILPFQGNREVFLEDGLNTFTDALPHHMRVYPLKKSDGTVELNAFVVALEGITTSFDFQDLVFVVRNARPIPPAHFSGGGLSNLLWRNGQTGANTLWTVQSDTLGSAASFSAQAIALPAVGDPNWKIVGTGDFNFDTKADILWRNTATGANTVWLMNGTVLASTVALPAVGDLGWHIGGTGDFDFDGSADILWRNHSTGANTVWLMNRTTFIASVPLPAVGDLAWQIGGTGDFDFDGRTDVLWRNTVTGVNSLWLMDQTTLKNTAALPAVGLDWQIGGVGDYDADNRPDILWRNTATGANAVWLMNDTVLGVSATLPPVADSKWQIRGPR
ncbi:FG-GAP-like repeat-containing protein [Gloeobacter violaceus]|uniref:Gll0046 protein n=1 Tax=Gloeobacter violaceus (strain ATCC 29082 / PCC 7421) TaxID=251221 RepID=Q7NPK9_GLOVI|nr:FG-GAP-like repeat-containing protein [Gloeobacter violaceus]BAC87987.1 gll0046 [Gloeobacter violaceus PCC 7421]